MPGMDQNKPYAEQAANVSFDVQTLPLPKGVAVMATRDDLRTAIRALMNGEPVPPSVMKRIHFFRID